MSLDSDVLAAEAVFESLLEIPLAARAIRLFGERVLAGENVAEALLKTGEILAAESAL